MDMKLNIIFPSFITTNQLQDDIDNDAIIEWCRERYRMCPQPKVAGGWQSTDQEHDHMLDPRLRPLIECLDHDIWQIRRKIGLGDDVEHRIANYWININEPGNYMLDSNSPHTHPGYFLNCVYYPQASEGSGNLELLNPVPGVIGAIPPQFLDYDEGWAKTQWSVAPETGKLVIFPSWLTHWVRPNRSDSDRISIAFNISLPRFEHGTVGTYIV
jgi:uncharacterized protein (TIGR02466 family)